MKEDHIVDIDKKAKDIITFIRTHRISMNKLEATCGIPQATLSKVLSGKIDLPIKHVRALEKELIKCGFTSAQT